MAPLRRPKLVLRPRAGPEPSREVAGVLRGFVMVNRGRQCGLEEKLFELLMVEELKCTGQSVSQPVKQSLSGMQIRLRMEHTVHNRVDVVGVVKCESQ